jgi:Arc/MetJ family transcription regulator
MTDARQSSATIGKPPKGKMARRPPLSSEELSGRVKGVAKRTRATVTLNDDLVRTAQAFTGIEDKSALLNVALTVLVEREATKRLTALGGTMPDLQRIPRRRMQGKER